MRGYSDPTSPLSVAETPLLCAARADRGERLAAAGVAAIALSWLTYTRFYFWLHPRHLTFDPSLFMYLTGKPDPSCGLTRTFAWMWRGDLGRAVAVYPLGPLVFIATFAILAYAILVVTGRSLQFNLSPRLQRGIVVGALIALGLNWAAKLIWLGM
jgi:Protein of unknown function (DUF2752)